MSISKMSRAFSSNNKKRPSYFHSWKDCSLLGAGVAHASKEERHCLGCSMALFSPVFAIRSHTLAVRHIAKESKTFWTVVLSGTVTSRASDQRRTFELLDLLVVLLGTLPTKMLYLFEVTDMKNIYSRLFFFSFSSREDPPGSGCCCKGKKSPTAETETCAQAGEFTPYILLHYFFCWTLFFQLCEDLC